MVDLKVALVDDDGRTLPDWVSESLAKEGIHLVVHNCTTRKELTQCAGDADVVWLFGSRILTAENLALLPRCGAIIRTGTGTDNVAVDVATELGIVVANTPEATSDEVADHTIALLLTSVRQIAVQDRLVRQGVWDRSQGMPRWHLKGNTLGLIGFGRTAQLVTRKLRGYEMTVLAYDPCLSAREIESEGAQARGLDEVVTQSDFVSLHCPLTKETYHLIGKRVLQLMKPKAILINISRGAVIDESALICALREGWIAGAGLDVLEQEPPDPENPLLKLDNVVITPHIAGYSDRHEEVSWRLAVETVIDLAHGRWPRSCVNPNVQPRWDLIGSRSQTIGDGG